MPDVAPLIDPARNAVDAVHNVYAEIDAKSELNAYVTLMKEDAVRRAEASESRKAAGEPLPLDGVLVAVKDNFCTKGVRSTAGSKILENFEPPYESFVTQRLLDAGAILVGKANLDEFGMGSSTEKGMHPATLNPNVRADGARVVAGGSSGGSAAAVAAGLADAAIGTDTGGSLRQPAAFCGVVGVKPTYGLCSRWGVMAYASSLDQPGVVTPTVAGAAEMLDVIIAQDKRDSTSVAYDGPGLVGALQETGGPFRVGLPKELIGDDQSETVAFIWDKIRAHCASAGIEIVEVSIPSIAYALPSYYIIALSEASSNLARYDGMRYGLSVDEQLPLTEYYETVRARGFGPEVQKRIMIGTYSLSSGYYDQYYLRATKVRRKLSDEFMAAAAGVDALVWPTAPTEAFEFGSDSDDPLTMYLQDVFTVPVNLVGAPAASLPVANSANNLPLGMQVVGKPMQDHKVLQIAQALEQAIGYARGV